MADLAGLVPYPETLAAMEARAVAVGGLGAQELVWLLEHPALYTSGTSAAPEELFRRSLSVFRAGRGGRFTYRGPGQRIVYVMLDLKRRGGDIRRFVWALEELADPQAGPVRGQAGGATGRIGVWVARPDGGEAKIGAMACGCGAGSATMGSP